MDSKMFVMVLDKIYNRLYKMNNFEADYSRKLYFSTDVDVNSFDDDARQLYLDSNKLFREHMSVTELINDVHDVMRAIEKFDL